ncbi:MAG TPA: DUF488 family protein [Terriglobales bacterium]|nr:DUF488 family protein [Terriglobales bacterium]
MNIEVKSILHEPSLSDGARVLVERRWPAGVKKDRANLDLWLAEVGVSPELAGWFAQHPQHALALRKRYFSELVTPEALAAMEKLYALAARRKCVTLLHAGRNAENTAAAMLKALMEGRRKPPSGSGPAKAAAASGRQRAARPRPR